MCDDIFEVVVYHGGYFETNETLSYSNGLTSMLACDPYRWSFFRDNENT